MTAGQRIMQHLLLEGAKQNDGSEWDVVLPEALDETNIEETYYDNTLTLTDLISDFREGQVETDIPCDYSRHYEAKSVASKLPDGTWVGWTYWYGGGKHGDPGSIEWIEDAYFLNVKEEEKLVVVRTFEKINEDN